MLWLQNTMLSAERLTARTKGPGSSLKVSEKLVTAMCELPSGPKWPTEPRGYPASHCSGAVQRQSLLSAVRSTFLTAQAAQGGAGRQALLQKELCQTLHSSAGREAALQTAASTSAAGRWGQLEVVRPGTGEMRNTCSFSLARYLGFSLLSPGSLRAVPLYCPILFVARPPLQLNSRIFLSLGTFFQGKVGNVARLQLLKMENFFPSPCKNMHKAQLWNTSAQVSTSWKDLGISPAPTGSGQAPQFA